MARLVHGAKLERITRAIIVVTWGMLLVYFLVCLPSTRPHVARGSAQVLGAGTVNSPPSLRSHQVAAVDAFTLIFPNGTCFWRASLAVVAMVGPVLQIRSMHSISYLCGPSSVAIVIAIAVMLGDLATHVPAGADTSTAADPVDASGSDDFLTLYASFSSFIFAYQGQSSRRPRLPTLI